MSQGTLFDLPDDPFNGLKHPKRPCTPALIGSGPSGETCGSCKHCSQVQYHDKPYRKCDLVKVSWSHGTGSDIKTGWSACRCWESRDIVVDPADQ